MFLERPDTWDKIQCCHFISQVMSDESVILHYMGQLTLTFYVLEGLNGSLEAKHLSSHT